MWRNLNSSSDFVSTWRNLNPHELGQRLSQLGYTLSLYRCVTVAFLRPSGSQPEDAEKAPAKAAKGHPGTMIVCRSDLHHIYIYIYIQYFALYVYRYLYIYIYVCVCWFIHSFIHSFIHFYMGVCAYVCICLCLYIYICIYIYIYLFTYVCVCLCIHM